MGDNIFLGDRNGVRTPMQWSADRNAGFSRANPQRLFLPHHHRPGVPLRDDQRRGAARQPVVAAVVDEAADRAAQAPPGLRPRRHPVPHAGQRQGAGVRPPRRAGAGAGGREPVAVLAAGGAGPVATARRDAGGDVRQRAVPGGRRRTGSTRCRSGRTGSTGSCWSRRRRAGRGRRRRCRRCGSARPTTSPLDDPAFERGAGGAAARGCCRRGGGSSPRPARSAARPRSLEQTRRPARPDGDDGSGRAPARRALFLIDVEFTEGEPDVYALPLSGHAPADAWQSTAGGRGRRADAADRPGGAAGGSCRTA